MSEPAVITVTLPDGYEVSADVSLSSAFTVLALITGWKVEAGFADHILCPGCGSRLKVDLEMTEEEVGGG